MFQSIKLQNFLSFGPDAPEIELRPLNVIIGRNGSGKSNLIDAIDLFRNAPRDIEKVIRKGGGVDAWIHSRGVSRSDFVTMEFHLSLRQRFPLVYRLAFEKGGHSIWIPNESLLANPSYEGEQSRYVFQRSLGQLDLLDGKYLSTKVPLLDQQSVLAQFSDPRASITTALVRDLKEVKIYTDWFFGRHTVLRQPVRTDLPTDYLEEDYSNLPLVLNHLESKGAKPELLKALKVFYDDVDDYFVKIEGNTAQLFFRESALEGPVPAIRLSDGTLRYLCLLCILLHPAPPPVICLEEPELGLHPDILPTLADLLRAASEKTQVIITTHSPILVDCFTDIPECVLVAEKEDAGTTLTRLVREDLLPWLERYSLGDYWTRGGLGGNIW